MHFFSPIQLVIFEKSSPSLKFSFLPAKWTNTIKRPIKVNSRLLIFHFIILDRDQVLAEFSHQRGAHNILSVSLATMAVSCGLAVSASSWALWFIFLRSCGAAIVWRPCQQEIAVFQVCEFAITAVRPPREACQLQTMWLITELVADCCGSGQVCPTRVIYWVLASSETVQWKGECRSDSVCTSIGRNCRLLMYFSRPWFKH